MSLSTILGPFNQLIPLFFGFIILMGFVGFAIILKNKLSGEENISPKLKPEYKYGPKQFFMTRAENMFYQSLVQTMGNDYAIFAQVHLPTIVDGNITGQNWKAARSRIDRKSVDFVLCDKQYLKPKLAIEFDDRTHERSERRTRDEFVEEVLRMAKLPLLRIKYSENISGAELINKINEKLTTGL